jgi:hypothetical protein
MVFALKFVRAVRKSRETEDTTSRSCPSCFSARHWYQLNIATAAVTTNSTHGRARPAVIRRHGMLGARSFTSGA